MCFFINIPAYGIELSNTLDNRHVPHRAQLNYMMGFRPTNDDPGTKLTMNLNVNYLIMQHTYVSFEASNFFTLTPRGTQYFSNIGIGIRHRFRNIPWNTTHLDIFGVFRFPNDLMVGQGGGTLTFFWEGFRWKIEPWVDFIFVKNTSPEARLAFRVGAAYTIWNWLSVHVNILRATGFHTPFFPISVTDPAGVYAYALFSNIGFKLRINDRITGHIETGFSLQRPVRNGNFKNVLVGVQYLL